MQVKTLSRKPFLIAAMSFLCSSFPVIASDVNSREYKLLLNPQLFSFSSEANTAQTLESQAKTSIANAIQRSVRGSFTLQKVRQIQFFDTPNECFLKQNGYVFRERVEQGASEVTLKFRSPDRFISGYEKLQSSTYGAETKLEEDISANAYTDFKSVYGHSTKAPNQRRINRINDVYYHFPDFERRYQIYSRTPLTAVNSTPIYERVYQGVEIDLGSIDAKVSLTLWYGQAPSGQQSPIIAELSFKYKDVNAEYTRKVVNRAKKSFDSLRALTTWVSPNSQTKTGWIFASNPSFCLPSN